MLDRFLAIKNSPNFYAALLCGAALVYFALALGMAATKTPWHDEGWFANPALNLATTGSMGTTILEGAGTWLEGVNRYTYWVMPAHLVTQAGWYKLFGFSLLTDRAASAAWGLVALASWFLIVKSLSGSSRIASLAFVLVAFDYWFLTSASTGRMDMMNAALGFASFAVYLHLRERNLRLAILLSQSLVVASGLTHPNGIFPFAALLFLTLYLDYSRLKLHYLAFALIPYLVGAAAWGLYILQEPSLFLAQFSGNVSGVSGFSGQWNRWSGLTSPLGGLKLELSTRYLNSFGLAPHSAGPARLKILILIAYVAGVIGAVCTRGIRQHVGYRVLLLIGLVYFVMMTLIEGIKSDFYLVHTTPILAAILAVWLYHCWTNRSVPRSVTTLVVCALLGIQISGILILIRRNDLRESYTPAINFIKQNSTDSSLIMGSAEFGFGLDFRENLVDDFRLGYHSGKQPDIIAVGKIYEQSFAAFKITEPQVHEHITELLSRQYRLAYHDPPYKIYVRR